MGTQIIPGIFTKEQEYPAEPTFTLSALDPVAPYLIRMWAAIHSGDALNAMAYAQDAIAHNIRTYQRAPANPEHTDAAVTTAQTMTTYRKEFHGGKS